ncbi:MAG: hypothetical protein KGL39_44085 [Patescibacteria group bacterium]|nr:hypothetical protein [Patescibacteria group bacterium]
MNVSDKAAYVKSEAKKGSGGHHCHADGCDAKVPPAMFMCKRHWFMVPLRLRNLIWALYEPGQEISKDADSAYIEVAREAIAAVRLKEGRP